MYSLYYLAYLVQKKNDLNRKRRRFYALKNPGQINLKIHPADPHFTDKWASDSTFNDSYQEIKFKEKYSWFSVPQPMHPAYSKLEAEQGYRKAQAEMKQMTKHMREVRESLGAKFRWGSGGQISAIRHEGKTYKEHWEFDIERNQHVKKSDIAALAEHYKAEQILKSA